jgi:catechol 2,3-dioxygenase-like lactoylglutathione lyase family enzyme
VTAREREGTLGVESLDHIYVECRDFEKTLGFWKALGFKVAATWGEDGHKAGKLTSGTASVVLAEAKKPEGPTIHFGIGGAKALGAKLAKSKAVKVVTPLEPTHWGTQWIRVQDPDGNVFSLEAPL